MGTHLFSASLCLFLWVAMAGAGPAAAVAQEAADEPPAPMTIKIYAVSDLLRADSPAAVGTAAAKLAAMLQSMVCPDDWRDNGGAGGEVRVLRDRLVVAQTPVVHAAVNAFLQTLRDQIVGMNTHPISARNPTTPFSTSRSATCA